MPVVIQNPAEVVLMNARGDLKPCFEVVSNELKTIIAMPKPQNCQRELSRSCHSVPFVANCPILFDFQLFYFSLFKLKS